jgi:hypothetical protein
MPDVILSGFTNPDPFSYCCLGRCERILVYIHVKQCGNCQYMGSARVLAGGTAGVVLALALALAQ